MTMQRHALRTLVRGAYDIQKLRIEMGNRIVANFKAKLGQEPGQKEDELDPKAKEILAVIRGSYKKLTDGLKKFPAADEFEGDEVISMLTELCLAEQFTTLEANERKHFKRLEAVLEEFPIYMQFLEQVRGIGPAMAGVIISEIDIHKCKYASSIWKYAGLDVINGQGRSRRKEHQVESEYIDKNGEVKTKMGISFNPFLKTKLIGVLADVFIKTRSPYRDLYDNYKNRMENHAKYGVQNDGVKVDGVAITSKGRRHAQSKRYMIKQMLVDLYTNWRALEGLDVHPPYHEAKLGMKHTA